MSRFSGNPPSLPHYRCQQNQHAIQSYHIRSMQHHHHHQHQRKFRIIFWIILKCKFLPHNTSLNNNNNKSNGNANPKHRFFAWDSKSSNKKKTKTSECQRPEVAKRARRTWWTKWKFMWICLVENFSDRSVVSIFRRWYCRQNDDDDTHTHTVAKYLFTTLNECDRHVHKE